MKRFMRDPRPGPRYQRPSHPAEEGVPSAIAVINPKQHGDVYPDKDLAGVGIAYKIAEAILDDRRQAIDHRPTVHCP